MQGKSFLIIGTDKKMQSCSDRLVEYGFSSHCCDGENLRRTIPSYTDIVLPLPSIANGCVAGTALSLQDFYETIDCNQTVYYGNISNPEFCCESYSYYYNEGFLIKNSRLTAQGALKLILGNTEVDLHSLSAAVLGYGRCGKAICKSLKRNGGKVTSFSRRSESRAEAENDGISAAECVSIDNELSGFDVIINTVPQNIIGEKCLERFTNKNLYLEIASKPYGFDIGRADKFNFRYILAESLPGKYTPISAGINIADTVIGFIKEGKA